MSSPSVSPQRAVIPPGGGPSPDALRRQAGRRSRGTQGRLLDSALEELRESGFEALTVRAAARRAGLSPATAYTYFSSKEHLVAELFWRLVAGLPEQRNRRGTVGGRAAAALAPVARAVASEPQLARACTSALLADDPDVRRLRDQIAHEWTRRVTSAVADHSDPDRVTVLLLAWSGMLLAAGTGHLSYSDIPARVTLAAEVILGETR